MEAITVFSHNHVKMTDDFSRSFQRGFVDILSRRYRNKRVHYNIVYNEYISDKDHTRIAATRWKGVADFCRYLQRKGLVDLDEDEKGLFIIYTAKDPEEEERQARAKRKERAERDDEERAARLVQQQIQLASAATVSAAAAEAPQTTELIRDSTAAPIKLAISLKKPEPKRAKTDTDVMSSAASATAKPANPLVQLPPIAAAVVPVAASADAWLQPDLVVKVLNRKVAAGKYYKLKGYIRRVEDKYLAEVCMLDSGDVLRVDQADLETVLPAIGGAIQVVLGKCRGRKGLLQVIREKDFCAEVKFDSGEVRSFPYEHICKLHAR
eukprot:TRINITY_DN12878_c0_g1_i1.p1 TRINITY_DN12878_c0_g1~~TRINITY_DN12878_c0_g1_i1.p1  ORF type:complete len:381 (-),score=87.03 TRINITY_DN12878_c0_g1_i1:191-1162(-)